MAIRLSVRFMDNGTADGWYTITAKGFITAMLCWADENGALKDWTALAYVPIDAAGKGEFQYQGGRAVPPEATHIFVRAVSEDLMNHEDALFRVPEKQRTVRHLDGTNICIMSDLHLSKKPWAVRKALSGACCADMTVLAGDLTNDGTKEQFSLLKECVTETLPDMCIFPVAGNHDILRSPDEESGESGTENYFDFQDWVLTRAKERILKDEGTFCDGPNGAYAAQIGNIEMIGLQAVTAGRKFMFEDGRQLEWLDERLNDTGHLDWHLIVCHAPLLKHNPKREAGKYNPYLNRDKQLQQIIESHTHVIFISGHTHLSMNHVDGCVEYDGSHIHSRNGMSRTGNIYINDGSIRPTDLLPGESQQPAEWRDGARLEMAVCPDEIEITTVSVGSGRRHARGYYRICG